ncbi:hypothetical protein AB0I51_16810 [Streptomyces sp. NPDC050549]|uniref:hypothetical protein n=1 Tax=Streptomyces sp. NPDC050549 TaxID=3155406 RepID=UPI00342DCC5B
MNTMSVNVATARSAAPVAHTRENTRDLTAHPDATTVTRQAAGGKTVSALLARQRRHVETVRVAEADPQ